jgi:hypothetical protein
MRLVSVLFVGGSCVVEAGEGGLELWEEVGLLHVWSILQRSYVNNLFCFFLLLCTQNFAHYFFPGLLYPGLVKFKLASALIELTKEHIKYMIWTNLDTIQLLIEPRLRNAS